jgi:3-oxoadipate enol-lactonase
MAGENRMPMIDSNGCRINVKVEGAENAPVLMLCNSLGTDMRMWDDQAPEFLKHYRLVRYDRRGHGGSDVPKGPYNMEMLARDALAVLDGLGIKQKINWCGLSMGGMVGQWLGANAPERINKMVLCNTHYYFPDKELWNGRLKMTREKGVPGMVDATMERWFTKDFRDNNPGPMAKIREMFVATPLEGYIACGEAVRDMDHRNLLDRIQVPTHVIAGRHDMATPLEANEHIREKIPGATITVLDAAHISNVAQPAAFTKAVLDFLGSR